MATSSAWDFVTIHLPKSAEQTVSIEYYIPAEDATTGSFVLISADDKFNDKYPAKLLGAWKKASVQLNSVGDNIEVGKLNTNKDGTLFTIYIACIWNGTVA